MFANGYLLLNSEWESYTKHFFKYLHEKINLSDINPNKIIYLCNAVDVEKEYYLFCKDNNIPKNKQVITIYSQHNFNNIENFIVPPKEKIINNKPKKFLCLNRVAREHRLALAGLLSYHRLIDQSFYSLGASHADLKSCPAMTDQITTGLNAIKSRIPFILDTENLDINQNGWNSLPRAYYDNSYFSLISGTWAFKEQEPSRSINEKEYKAIMYKHPFILWTRPFTLKYLRQEGFMTFSKWFDESYDCEEDDLKRLEMIIMEVKRLCSLESYVLDNMVRDMENVLNYNYFNLIDRVVDRVYYHTDLKYLAKYAA
jgi:hypothetical protein